MEHGDTNGYGSLDPEVTVTSMEIMGHLQSNWTCEAKVPRNHNL